MGLETDSTKTGREGGTRPGSDQGRLKLMVMASGSGTNLKAILEACRQGKVSAEVVLVVSDNPGALALVKAREYGVAAVAVDPSGYPSRRAHEEAIVAYARPYEPELVVLAGYMRLVTPYFLEAFAGRLRGKPRLPGVINIHPADTKVYQGTRGYEFALGLTKGSKGRLKETWVTVHFVDEGMDTGPVIRKRAVQVKETDTLETLKERGLAIEHELYPEVIDLIARGRVVLGEGGRVVVRDKA